MGGLISPLTEEIFFRGLIYGFFLRWGWPLALALSTLSFVAAHLPAEVWLPQLVGGLVFALAYRVSGSLAAPAVIHVLGNLAIFSLGLIAA